MVGERPGRVPDPAGRNIISYHIIVLYITSRSSGSPWSESDQTETERAAPRRGEGKGGAEARRRRHVGCAAGPYYWSKRPVHNTGQTGRSTILVKTGPEAAVASGARPVNSTGPRVSRCRGPGAPVLARPRMTRLPGFRVRIRNPPPLSLSLGQSWPCLRSLHGGRKRWGSRGRR